MGTRHPGRLSTRLQHSFAIQRKGKEHQRSASCHRRYPPFLVRCLRRRETGVQRGRCRQAFCHHPAWRPHTAAPLAAAWSAAALDGGARREGRSPDVADRQHLVYIPPRQQPLGKRPSAYHQRYPRLLLFVVGLVLARWPLLCHRSHHAGSEALRLLCGVIAQGPSGARTSQAGVCQAGRLAQLPRASHCRRGHRACHRAVDRTLPTSVPGVGTSLGQELADRYSK